MMGFATCYAALYLVDGALADQGFCLSIGQ